MAGGSIAVAAHVAAARIIAFEDRRRPAVTAAPVAQGAPA
jgi:hypothetical protein